MQEELKLYVRGNLSIGDTVKTNEGKLAVVTRILTIESCDYKEYDLLMESVVQLVGTVVDYDEVDEEPTIIEMDYPNYYEEGGSLFELGFTMADNDRPCVQLTDLLSISSEQGNVIIEYEVSDIFPWSEEELKAAVKKDRINTFDVIDGIVPE